MWGKNVQGSNDENVLPTTWPAAAFPAQFVSKYLLHVCVFAERWSVNLQFFLLSGCSHNHCFVEEIKTSGKQFPVNIWSILAQTLLSKPSIKTLQQCCLIPCCVLTALCPTLGLWNLFLPLHISFSCRCWKSTGVRAISAWLWLLNWLLEAVIAHCHFSFAAAELSCSVFLLFHL